MNIAILFINIGHYHYARLWAAHEAFRRRGWRLVGVQVTANTLRHPWGSLNDPGDVPLITLDQDRHGHVTSEGDVPSMSMTRVQQCLDAIKPNVVFLPGWSFDICRKALAWCRKKNVPAVLMSESKYDDEPRWRLKEMLKSHLFARRFHAALVGGAPHRDYAERLGIRRDAIFTGYDVVDNAHFESGADTARADPEGTRKRFRAIPAGPYFVAASRMVARKNIVGLVLAYDQYLRAVGGRSSAWDLVICGDGPEFSAVEAEVERCGLQQKVHLPGFITYSQMPAWYGLAAAFVHPALQEQWGLVLNEACASALPVVVSSTVGARYDLVEDGGNGLLVDPTSTRDIAAKLARLHNSSRESLEHMGAQSRMLARALSPERFGEGAVNAALACCPDAR